MLIRDTFSFLSEQNNHYNDDVNAMLQYVSLEMHVLDLEGACMSVVVQ